MRRYSDIDVGSTNFPCPLVREPSSLYFTQVKPAIFLDAPLAQQALSPSNRAGYDLVDVK
jgi:hypothetical protein